MDIPAGGGARSAALLLGLLVVVSSIAGFSLASRSLPPSAVMPRGQVGSALASSPSPTAAALPSGGLWYDPLPWPWAMWGQSMAYDSAADRLVLFGGSGPDGVSGDTWAYDPGANTWTNLRPAVHPPARYGGVMAYDGRADRFVLFGGMASYSWTLDDTWVYDYGNNTWTEAQPATSPQANRGGGLVYDSRADLLLLYGGCSRYTTPGCVQMSETWAFDVVRGNWTLLATSSNPGPLSEFALAYSPVWDRSILFGGYPPNCCVIPPPISGATWSFDYANRTWSDLGPSSPPPGVVDQSLAYDVRAHRMIMVGGDQGTTPNSFVGTFAFDYANDTWATLSPSGGLGPFANEAMDYDPVVDRMLLYTEGGPLGPVWRFDYPSDAWAAGAVPSVQPAEQRPAFAYDSKADGLLFFGGCTGATNGCGNQTRWLDIASGTWSNRSGPWINGTPPVAPSPRYASATGYDSRSDRFVLFGGTDQNFELGDTWTFDAGNHTWARLHPSSAPAPRDDMAAAYDPRADRLLLFGGELALSNVSYTDFASDTWSFDLANDTWTNVTPAVGPPARVGGRMAYDSRLDRFVLFGGLQEDGAVLGDTWTFDLATDTWTNVTKAYGPPARMDGDFAYDGAADRFVLFGGTSLRFVYSSSCYDLSCFFGDTWAYDALNGTWIAANPSPSPSPRFMPSLAYVSSQGAVALVGGNEGILGTYQDSWFYRYGPSVPTSVLSLQAVSGSSLIRLSWLPPASDGDSPIAGYRVYRNATGGTTFGPWVPLATLGLVLTHDDVNVVNGVWYSYVVTAVNGVGEGPWLIVATAAPGPSVTLASVSGRAGTAVNVTGTVSDLEAGGTWSIDFGDGSPPVSGRYAFGTNQVKAPHTYATGGVFTIHLTATHGLAPATATATATMQPEPQPAVYAVTFTESGLPAGTNWSVTLNGATRATSGTTDSFVDPNGTYAYVVNLPDGFTSTPRTGNVTVAGHDASASIVFTATESSSTFLGLPAGWAYAVMAAVVIVAAALVLATVWMRRRKAPPVPPGEAPQGPKT